MARRVAAASFRRCGGACRPRGQLSSGRVAGGASLTHCTNHFFSDTFCLQRADSSLAYACVLFHWRFDSESSTLVLLLNHTDASLRRRQATGSTARRLPISSRRQPTRPPAVVGAQMLPAPLQMPLAVAAAAARRWRRGCSPPSPGRRTPGALLASGRRPQPRWPLPPPTPLRCAPGAASRPPLPALCRSRPAPPEAGGALRRRGAGGGRAVLSARGELQRQQW